MDEEAIFQGSIDHVYEKIDAFNSRNKEADSIYVSISTMRNCSDSR